jgi:hypothetical protein
MLPLLAAEAVLPPGPASLGLGRAHSRAARTVRERASLPPGPVRIPRGRQAMVRSPFVP